MSLLLAAATLSSCEVSVGSDEPTTVTQATPTVTEREVIKRRTAGPETTTAPAPDDGDAVGGNVQEAIATVSREGYDVPDPGTYDPNFPLRVLIGIRQDSATAYAQRAFFFFGDDYLGNDTSDDSAGIEYAGQDDKHHLADLHALPKGRPELLPHRG